MDKLINITIINISLSILFTFIPNKSNFKSEYYIPILVSLITKYIVGDFDKEYVYTLSDISYWIYNIFISYFVIKLKNKIY
jgi:hypothetical protein